MLKQAILGIAVLGMIVTGGRLQAQDVNLSGDTLRIDCRAGVNENVRIFPGGYDQIGQIDNIIVRKTDGTMVTDIDARFVRKITFVGNSGNDTCIIETNFRGETVSDASRYYGGGTVKVVMIGREGDDTLNSGEETNDSIYGGGGNDVIAPGSTGEDLVSGGQGADIFELYYRFSSRYPFRIYNAKLKDYNYPSDRIIGIPIWY